MYGLKQAGIIPHRKLIKHLAPYGYHPVPFTPVLWKHDTKHTMFTLVVDNFSINYMKISDAEHLLSALRDKYTITTDMECKKHISITLEWDYINKHVTFSMPNYVTTTLHKLQHVIPSASGNYPHIHVKPSYGANIQYAHYPDLPPRLQEKGITIIQKIPGKFIYYGIAIDNTIITALSDPDSKQSCATKTTAQKITKLLNYLATNPVAKL